MSQVGRTVKNLEAPRPLKSATARQTNAHTSFYEVQSVEELIQLTENVAVTLSSGCNNSESMSILLSNLRLHGPQLEIISKDTLDRAFVTFRNASQDERLNLMTRLILLELIELRAKSWQNSDGINLYYKHKATNVEPELFPLPSDLTLLGTSPPRLNLGQPIVPVLAPGELLRNSGKFTKPTKIPGKNYSKDEVVIRNADSGKVTPGAKERLVQITGPSEEKIDYAKQLIEDTIRRNASPVRLETSHEGAGSCSSLASSASDDTSPRVNNRNNIAQLLPSSIGSAVMNATQTGVVSNQTPNFVPNPSAADKTSASTAKGAAGRNGGAMLLHSFSTNDASLGEYKYTVNVGQHNIKITGDCFELVRAAKLVLDDYFSSSEFLASVEAGAAFDAGPQMLPLTIGSGSMMPSTHQLNSSSPFVDSGIGLNLMSAQSPGSPGTQGINHFENDDDVFIIESGTTLGENAVMSTPNPQISNNSSNLTQCDVKSSASTSNSTSFATTNPMNGLTRSRRSHFSRKDSTPEGATKDITNAIKEDYNSGRIVHEYESLLYYSKSPHSWVLPRDWIKICNKFPTLIKNKLLDDEKLRFDPDKHLTLTKSRSIHQIIPSEDMSGSPDTE